MADGDEEYLTDDQHAAFLQGKIIECSWAVTVGHSKSENRWFTMLTFHDETERKFRLNFGLGTVEQVQALIDRLTKAKQTMMGLTN